MSYTLRKTIYLCRSPKCKRQNAVMERVHDDGQVDTPPSWQHHCICGCGSLDLTYTKEFRTHERYEPYSTLGA